MSSQLAKEALPPSEAVINRVADQEGVDPLELTPLYESIDPEALDAFIRATKNADSECHVEFTYHGHSVTVTSKGVVEIDEGAISV